MGLPTNSTYYPPAQRREAQRLKEMGLPPAKVAEQLNLIASANASLRWPAITRKRTADWVHGRNSTGFEGADLTVKGLSSANRHLVFVYGTLKKGFGNHPRLKGGGGLYWGRGITISPFILYDGPFPKLGDVREMQPGNKTFISLAGRVEGEVYLVDDNTLKDLDYLEGTPVHYRRDKTWIELSDKETVEAGIYVIQRQPMDKPMVPDDAGLLSWTPQYLRNAAE